MLDRGEHARQAERQDQHADHLHHGGDAEDPVVGVVGRGEPREVGPGPADAEAREAEAEQGRQVVALRQRMSELRGGEAEADHERQVEQQFKWRGDTVRLVAIASTHSPRVMVEAVGDRRCNTHAESPLEGACVRFGLVSQLLQLSWLRE